MGAYENGRCPSNLSAECLRLFEPRLLDRQTGASVLARAPHVCPQSSMPKRVLVVGGGAAGIFAALAAAKKGASVTILEKTVRLGTKILISGGGKCNLTHAGPLEEVLRAFRPNEARFIRPACYRFRPEQFVSMVEARGLATYVRPDGRIFPVDGTAKDVVRILEDYLYEAGVETHFETPAVGLLASEGRITGVVTGPPAEAHKGHQGSARQGETKEWMADAVIVSTGGSSYPNSGTTGDGWPWVRDLGHTVVKVRAALAPMYLVAERVRPEWSGVALRDIVLKARDGKEFVRWRGDLLFTHQGVSGPTVLGVSREVAERPGSSLDVDLRPDETPESLTEILLGQPVKRLVASYLEELVPQRLVEGLSKDAGLEDGTAFGKLDRKTRNRLVETIKRWNLGVVRAVPLEKGEVVAGGVALDEVDPQTMASRKVEGLYLCGEVLDVAGPVGGYNLQAAWATGFVAGESASAYLDARA
ncbi:aminoacetone oxidase family FAD-binding enzyme [bacterium]|nr:MAG: aminoacetone oxidase family FAD-binding enzyme [bacterium]